VLSVEGATFVDRDLAQVQAAYDQGVRHIQLVHFLSNPIGDIQTEQAEHGGLTDFGRQVIETCNRLGILVDLAHCTAETVRAALDVSKAPMIWSHSSVPLERRLGGWFPSAWQRRQLDRDTAKTIASKGGVVGLWALGADVGTTVESYAGRIENSASGLAGSTLPSART
jgi:membrane dipeptidase